MDYPFHIGNFFEDTFQMASQIYLRFIKIYLVKKNIYLDTCEKKTIQMRVRAFCRFGIHIPWNGDSEDSRSESHISDICAYDLMIRAVGGDAGSVTTPPKLEPTGPFSIGEGKPLSPPNQILSFLDSC